MGLSIEYLKNVIPVGQTKMINSDGSEQIILRASINAQVLHVAGKFCSWENLYTLLNKKGCKLNLKESQQTIFPEEKKQHGGCRPGAGRKKKILSEKKMPVSIALVHEDDFHLKKMAKHLGISKSQLVTDLIKSKWEEMYMDFVYD